MDISHSLWAWGKILQTSFTDVRHLGENNTVRNRTERQKQKKTEACRNEVGHPETFSYCMIKYKR